MKCLPIIAFTLLSMLAAPLAAQAQSGANVRVIYSGTGQPVRDIGLTNQPQAPDGGNPYSRYYDPVTGYRSGGFSATGELTWEQDTGSDAGLLYLHSGHTIYRKAYDCTGLASASQSAPTRDSFGGAMWTFDHVALTAAPYQGVTLTVQGAVQPVTPQITAAESDFVARVNEERTRLGMGLLHIDTRLSLIADSQAYFQDSAAPGQPTHCGPQRSTPLRRLLEIEDVTSDTYASEIASWEPTMTGQAVWTTYKGSQGHYAILTDPRLTCIGVGFSASHTTGLLQAGSCDTGDVGVRLADTNEDGAPIVDSADDTQLIGPARVGAHLTCRGAGAVRWERSDDSANVDSGQLAGRGAAYTVTRRDLGRSMRCVAGDAPSEWTGLVHAHLTALHVRGAARVGRVLSCTGGFNAGQRMVWQRRAGHRWVTIGSARTLRLGAKLRGQSVRCAASMHAGDLVQTAVSTPARVR